MGKTGKSRRARAVATAAVLCLACAGGIAAAQAQDPTDPDTELTPKPKEATQWSLLGGAKYRGGGKPVEESSPTDHTVDFFTTSFSPEFVGDPGNPEGFFAGAECIDDDVPFEDEALKSCERRPALYRFWIDEVGDEHIAKVPTDELVDDPDEQGFIGALAWIDGNRALAVGGTGTYPRREPAPATPKDGESEDAAYLRKDKHGEPGSEDKPAGLARAWIYEDPDAGGPDERRWREITDELPPDKNEDGSDSEAPMGALTALECTYNGMRETSSAAPFLMPAGKSGTCLAGGLQRMWWWRPESSSFDPDPETSLEIKTASTSLLGVSTPSEPDFHHRVRQIRVSEMTNEFVAVTAGCCAPRVQLKEGPDDLPSGKAEAALGARKLTYSVKLKNWSSTPVSTAGEDAGAAGAPVADSVYSLASKHGQATADPDDIRKSAVGSGVASPGAGPTPGTEEPGSRITNDNVSSKPLEGVRLLAADGDFAHPKSPINDAVSPESEFATPADGILDWAVGSLKQGNLEGTAQGVAYTTLDPLFAVPPPMSCPLTGNEGMFGFSGLQRSCELMRENITNASLASKRLIGMGTYALNSIHFIFKTTAAWAAGDRGAIARLGGAGGKLGSEVEPNAPKLKPGKPKPLAERAPFEEKRPPAADPGSVPPRAAQPVDALPKHEIVPYGSADPSRFMGERVEVPTEIAMSRDGSEGWAIGSRSFEVQDVGVAIRPAMAGLQHFDGERWTLCSPDLGGLRGTVETDPACASVAKALRGPATGRWPQLTAIARVPLELDGDPSNDDEFEVLAVGAKPDGKSLFLVYRDGAWSVDDAASELISTGAPEGAAYELSIAFTTPGDAWLTVKDTGNSTQSSLKLYHYGGGDLPNGRWVSCSKPSADQIPEECGGAASEKLLSTGGGFGVETGELQAAGDTVFIAGNRRPSGGSGTPSVGRYPYVYYKRPGEPWRKEYDPGCEEVVVPPSGGQRCRPKATDEDLDPIDDNQGEVFSFAAVDLGGGRVAGWLLGNFGLQDSLGIATGATPTNDFNRPVKGPKYTLMRRGPAVPLGSEGAWSHWQADDAANDLLPVRGFGQEPPQLVGFRGADGRERAFITTSGGRYMQTSSPPLEFDPELEPDEAPAKRGRWKVMPAPFLSTNNIWTYSTRPEGRFPTRRLGQGEITAMAPDNQGGVWIAARAQDWVFASHESADMWPHRASFYYRYTDRRPKAVFEDSPSPITEEITDLEGNRHGTVWVSTRSNNLYRYEQIGGWERVAIPEWDRGRVITRRSKAFAVAVNDAGVGIAVGEQGRIATISPDSVTLDAASVNRCSEAPPPCGTPKTLRAAAVSPDGSALAGGDNLTVTWRPAGGHFRLVDAPRSSSTAKITALTMPDGARAWATLDNGEIWAGKLVDPAGERPWQWVRESPASAAGDERGVSHLFDIEVNADGRGLAVGFRGAILERRSDETWKRLSTGYLDNFFSVELPPQGYGDGTLIGGGAGVILTRANGRFHIARHADPLDPVISDALLLSSGQIVGLAISGGADEGDTEVWAASQADYDHALWRDRNPPAHALFHYGSGDDALLDPERRATPLGDVPKERPAELALAAFGRSECQTHGCAPFMGNNHFNDLLARRINAEVIDRDARSHNPVVAVSTGDLNEAPGREDQTVQPVGGLVREYVHTVNQPNVAHNQWRQFVADPLIENGIPTFATLGERDLSRARHSKENEGYKDPRELAGTGITKQWRETFATMPAPWGLQDPFETDAYEYRPVAAGAGAVEHPDVVVEDPTKPVPTQTVEDPTKGTEDPTIADRKQWIPRPGDQKVPPRTEDRKIEGGAHTHYALDVVSKANGDVLSRIVVADTSNLRSLTASDPNQNPAEPQQGWLEQVLCSEGSPADTAGLDCTRPEKTPAVVVTTTPPYSYGAGAIEQTQQEAAAFEALMLRHRVTALITGHMGWNGLTTPSLPRFTIPSPAASILTQRGHLQDQATIAVLIQAICRSRSPTPARSAAITPSPVPFQP